MRKNNNKKRTRKRGKEEKMMIGEKMKEERGEKKGKLKLSQRNFNNHRKIIMQMFP